MVGWEHGDVAPAHTAAHNRLRVAMSSQSTTNVVVVDAHRVLRAGLRLLLERAKDIHCIAEASDPDEAVSAIAEGHPDVAVVDTQGANGDDHFVSVRVIHHHHPEVRLVALSGDGGLDDVRAAFGAGAHGYVQADASLDELLEAVRTVARGERYLHPSLGAVIAQPTARDPLAELTCREREVLQLLALGYGNQEIAGRLHLSPRTVETHRSHLMTKLRVTSRAELVRIALEAGMLTVASAAAPPG